MHNKASGHGEKLQSQAHAAVPTAPRSSKPAGINPKVKPELLNPLFESESLLQFLLFHSVPSFCTKVHIVHNDSDCYSVVLIVKYVLKNVLSDCMAIKLL